MQKALACLALTLAIFCLGTVAGNAGPHGCYSSHCGKR